MGVTGSPILKDSLGYADCKVINAMDGGDMSTFLVNVVDGGIISSGEWMTLDYFYSAAPPEWIAEYGEKLSRSVAFSLERIHKIESLFQFNNFLTNVLPSLRYTRPLD